MLVSKADARCQAQLPPRNYLSPATAQAVLRYHGGAGWRGAVEACMQSHRYAAGPAHSTRTVGSEASLKAV